MDISRYKKFVVALIGAAIAFGLQLAADGTLGEWGPSVTAVLTSFGVYFARNKIVPGDGKV